MEGTILLWIQENLRNDVLTPIMKVITSLGDKGIIAILATCILLAIPKTRKIGVYCFVSLALTFLINNILLKNIVNRTRPYDAVEGLIAIARKPHDASFPSGHSAASFCVAIVMVCKMKKRYGIPAVILASLIALSRLYVGVHYPTDVLGGILIGSGMAVVSLFVTPILLKKFDEWNEKRLAKKAAVNEKPAEEKTEADSE